MKTKKATDVVLTLKQAQLLLVCAQAHASRWGLTPMERLLVGAAARRIKAAAAASRKGAKARKV